MKPIKFFILGFIAMTLIAIAAGCTSTEVVAPQKEFEEKGETILLNLECPEALKATRAGTDHVLRYTVVLYVGNAIDNSKEYERREEIASDENTQTMIFQVPEDTYTFLIIGDYIPKDNVDQKSNGHYPDKYYDTSLTDDKLYMKSFRDFKQTIYTPVAYNCVNNDNYDCFAQTIQIQKGAEKVERNVTLKRIVSKISFVSTTSAPSEITSIVFNTLDFFYHYNFTEKIAGSQATSVLSKDILSNISHKALSSDTDAEFMYFYTFAPLFDLRGAELSEIKFTINYADNSSYQVTVTDRLLKPAANYKLTVKGPLFSEKEKELGDIILHLSIDEEWLSLSNN